MPETFRLMRILLQFLVISIIVAPALSQNSTLDNANSERFILDIYPDRAGEALVIGYADNLKSLPFLGTSEYKYNNDTKQLFARTDSLTSKDGDLWTLRFNLPGRIGEYYTAFYLPSDVKLKEVNRSVGLGNFISLRNESLIVEVQGYVVQDPAVTIEYQQPLTKANETNSLPTNNSTYIYLISAGAVLALGLALLGARFRERRLKSAQSNAQQIESYTNSAEIADGLETTMQKSTKSIKVTSELETVAKTLTENELAVLNALLSHGGCMTQVDLRHETNLAKSSLFGVLLSLERRKIITKKESGRTNLIELSEKFLSK